MAFQLKSYIFSTNNKLEDFSLDDVPEEAPKFESSKEVDIIIKDIVNSLAPFKANPTQTISKDDEKVPTMEEIKLKFDKIFAQVRESNLSDNEKKQVFTEATMILTSEEEEKRDIANAPVNTISTFVSKVPVYASSNAPIVVISGKGPVSRKVASIALDLGKTGDFRFLEAEQLSVTRDYELKYSLKGAKSVVIIADADIVEKKNWLGLVERQEGPCPLTSNGLKKLLNAVMAEEAASYNTPSLSPISSSSSTRGIKVAILGLASPPAQSVSSLVGSLLGDGSASGAGTGALAEETLLMCAQRKLAYCQIKVGRLLDDSKPFPEGVRDRSVVRLSLFPSSLGRENKDLFVLTKGGSSPDPGRSPVLFTRSRTVESSEVTYVSVAAEALLRSLSHPHTNVSVSVLSTPFANPSHSSASSTSTSTSISAVTNNYEFISEG